MLNQRIRNNRARYMSRAHVGLKKGAKRKMGSSETRRKFEVAQDGYFIWSNSNKVEK
jgi:hypothetical protein